MLLYLAEKRGIYVMNEDIYLHAIYAKSDSYNHKETNRILEKILDSGALLSLTKQNLKALGSFNGNDYISKKDLLKFLAEISDAVNTFSDRGDPIRAEGANKVISLLLEKIVPPQEHWKPSKEQMTNLLRAEGRLRIEGENVLAGKLAEIYEQLKKL